MFGFPPSASSTILNHFSQLGQLLESRFPPKGNWVNLHYYSKMEARRALTYHGKVFGGTTMIGVMPCKDPVSSNFYCFIFVKTKCLLLKWF